MNKRIRAVWAGVAAGSTVAALMLGSAGTAQAAGGVGPASAGRGGSSPVRTVFSAPVDRALARQNAQLVAIEGFRAIAAAAPDRFAGVSTQGSARVSVNLAGDPARSAADVAAIRREAAAVGIAVSFPVRQYSLSDLARIKDAATHDAALAGAAPVAATIDPATDSVQLVTTGAASALRAKARGRFGDAVTVASVAPATLAQGRFNDSSPYWGGDRIGNTTGSCTYGFAITNAYGTHYGLTAGHCWAVGSGVDVTAQTGGTHNLGAGYATFGTVQYRRFGNGSLDAELVGGMNYAGDMWIGADLANNSDVYAPVHGAHASCSGCGVYFNGSFTGKSLATVVSSGPGCYSFYDAETGTDVQPCGIWEAQAASSSHPICQPGDSGGPVFAYDGSGGVTAVGIIDACNSDGTIGYYSDINQILSSWTSTITTG